jgi:hypothetical protein
MLQAGVTEELVDEWVLEVGSPTEFTFDLEFNGATFDHFQATPESPRQVDESGRFIYADGHLDLDIVDEGDTYQFTADESNDQLQLRFIDSTERGTAEDKAKHARFTIAFYTSAPFVRQPSDATTIAPPSTAAVGDPTAVLIGSWHRAQSCAEILAAFQAAGLAESHVGWLQGNFFGGEPGPTTGDPCAGALGPLEHDHFFTEAGAFGSHDENGEVVDDGDFAVVDGDTVSFPSHATEFGYEGALVVGYSVEGDVVVFDVVLPEPCVDACADAYAWALSAFASGPWERGEVP